MKIAIDFDGVVCERYGIPTKNPFTNCPMVDGADATPRQVEPGEFPRSIPDMEDPY